MKTNPYRASQLRRFTAGCVVLIGLSLSPLAFAGPGLQHWQTLRSEKQFKQLKAGDKIAYVCNECKTVSETAVDSPAHAAEMCKEGASVSCPACKVQTKVIVKQKRNDPPVREEITFVNAKGEECLFIAQAAKAN